MTNNDEETPTTRVICVWDCLTVNQQIKYLHTIETISYIVEASEGIMKRWLVRVFFAFITVLSFILLLTLAPRMPQGAAVAGVILGIVLTVITVMIWLSSDPPDD